MDDKITLVGRDVLEHLKNLKRYGHRGQTSTELLFYFRGLVSEQAVYNQLRHLLKWKQIRKVKVKYGRKEVLFYEVVD